VGGMHVWPPPGTDTRFPPTQKRRQSTPACRLRGRDPPSARKVLTLAYPGKVAGGRHQAVTKHGLIYVIPT